MERGRFLKLLILLFILFILGGCAPKTQNVSNVWQKTYGGSNYDEAYSIQQTTDGGYIVAGETGSFGAGGGGCLHNKA